MAVPVLCLSAWKQKLRKHALLLTWKRQLFPLRIGECGVLSFPRAHLSRVGQFSPSGQPLGFFFLHFPLVKYLQVQSDLKPFVRVDLISPWGEIVHFYLRPPEPKLPIDSALYTFVLERCEWEECNRLYFVAEEGHKIYHDRKCYTAAKRWREKQRRAAK